MTVSLDTASAGNPVHNDRLSTLFSDDDRRHGTKKPRLDLKRIALIGGLGVLSWISTYTGMLELIQANMGGLDITIKIAIALSVAMLMLMIIWLLDQIFGPSAGMTKMLFIVGYLFLSLISIGFSFGFYWKFLESRSEASRSAESAVTQVQSALHGAETRLAQLVTTFDVLTGVSTAKATDEVAKGTSCPNSRPGDGPRRRMREADATSFSFAGQFVKERAAALKAEAASLDTDLAKVVLQDKSTFAKDGTRNEFMRELGRKLDRAVVGFNAFRTDPQLRQFRSDFADRSERTVFADEQGGQFTCPDPQLQTALRGVVKAIDQLPELEKPAIAAVEGAEATIEAFRRLAVTLTGLVQLKMPPSADEIRDEQKRAIQSVDQHAKARALDDVVVGLGKRDWIPLMIAVFVDFCLLLVSFSRPMNRFQALIPKMREAQEWPVIEILSKFHGIHEDDTIRKTFEVLRHVVFSFHGVYYAAIPLNGGDGGTSRDNEAADLEAYLLNNLFTSFERERIFRPVAVSLFTNGYIQKRLAQQRSKYAEVEAFKVYRFSNGAWPEMILSAIMGAAKRVEAEQRRLRGLRDEADARAAEERFAAQKAAAKASRKWRWRVEPGFEDGAAGPELGDVANDTTAKSDAPATADGGTAAEAKMTASEPTKRATTPNEQELTRLVAQVSDMVSQQKTLIERQSKRIDELTRPARTADTGAASNVLSGLFSGPPPGSRGPIRQAPDFRASAAHAEPFAGPPRRPIVAADLHVPGGPGERMAVSGGASAIASATPVTVIHLPAAEPARVGDASFETAPQGELPLGPPTAEPVVAHRIATSLPIEASLVSRLAGAIGSEAMQPIVPDDQAIDGRTLGPFGARPEAVVSSSAEIARFLEQADRHDQPLAFDAAAGSPSSAPAFDAAAMPVPYVEAALVSRERHGWGEAGPGWQRDQRSALSGRHEIEHVLPTESVDLDVRSITAWYKRGSDGKGGRGGRQRS